MWNTPAVPAGATGLSFGLAGNSGTMSTTGYSLKLFKIVKSHKEAILLGLLAFVIVAAGLITRGHYRYARYVKAEAAEAAAETARAAAQAGRAAAESVKASADTVKAEAEPVKPKPEPVKAKAEPAKAQRVTPEDATVIMKAINPSGTRRATRE